MNFQLIFILLVINTGIGLYSGFKVKEHCYVEDYDEKKELLNCAHVNITHVVFNDTDLDIKNAVYMLDLSKNNIFQVLPGALAEFDSLNILILSYNKIRDLSLVRLPALKMLQVLDLSFNSVEILDWSIFKDVENLEVLDLSNNHIKTILGPHAGIQLNKLVLTNNPMTCIRNLPISIKVLDISQTHLTAQELLEVANRQQLVSLKLEQLQFLNETLRHTFLGLENLEEISMKNCANLLRIDEESLGKWNRKLKWLDLSNCALRSLPKKLDQVLLNIHWLDLRYNPWNCDKRIEWMSRFLLSTTLTVPEFRCFNPPNLRGFPWLRVLGARNHLNKVHSKILAGAWLLIFIGTTIVVMFMVRRKMRKNKINSALINEKYNLHQYSRLKETIY